MTSGIAKHMLFCPRGVLVAAFLMGLAQTASAAAAPVPATDGLTCAAVYGVISARPASPRSQAATMARAKLLEMRGLTVDAPEVVAADASSSSQELATAGVMDERAGGCDRAHGFKVAEESPLAFRKTTISPNAQSGPYPRPQVTTPARLPPPEEEKAPAATGSWGVLYTRCNGEKRSFDPGLSRDALVRAARAQGCTDLDIDNLLQTRDLLSF